MAQSQKINALVNQLKAGEITYHEFVLKVSTDNADLTKEDLLEAILFMDERTTFLGYEAKRAHDFAQSVGIKIDEGMGVTHQALLTQDLKIALRVLRRIGDDLVDEI